MNPALDKLTKYLRLEAERGYDNRAVLGGLNRILEPWEAEARRLALPESLIQAVVSRLRDYPQLTSRSREEVVRGLWSRLRTDFPEITPTGEAESSPTTEDTERAPSETPAAVREPEPVVEAETAPSGVDQGAEAIPAQDSPPALVAEGVDADSSHTQQDHAAGKPRRRGPAEPLDLASPLTSVSGIGPKSAKTLEKLGLRTLGDLLWYVPRRYDDYSRLETINRLFIGDVVTIMATVEEIHLRPARGGRMKIVEAIVGDDTGKLRITWFNQPWIAQNLTPERTIVLSGKIEQYLGRLTMNNPEWEAVERQQLNTNRIVPVYPLTSGVTQKWLRKVISSMVTGFTPRVIDPIPAGIRASANLIPLTTALTQIHFPDSWEDLQRAQSRLAFDEMFLLQLSVLKQKVEWQQLHAEPLTVTDEWIEHFKRALPFELTAAQARALDDTRADLARSQPMNRLLQGDVGSGKTIIGAAAIGIAAANAVQSAMLAPTSILADQHFKTLSDLLPRAAGIPASSIRLLIGATPEPEKEEIRTGLRQGSIHVVVGTHALLEDPIEFDRLGLAVIDEQHRFGVDQRATLRAKGDSPNLMVMTATPIPRSLALTVYGDLDLTVIDEMPPQRLPVETRVLHPIERLRAYHFIRGQLEMGHQAFVIYPLVEESDKVDAKAAVAEHQKLQDEMFPGYRLGLLHGRMRPDDKDSVMAAFRRGEYHVLVSTSVVEVGVDIPNATVMLIEGANRFGLSQLHQFRGRVGRSAYKSYCMLIPDSEDEAENERLKAMESTNDGFRLAELDLEQRGPGDFLGTRQSGFAELKMARLTDVRLIDKARREAMRLFEADPGLASSENGPLAEAVARFISAGKGEIS